MKRLYDLFWIGDLGYFMDIIGTGRDLSVRFDKLEYFVIFDLLKPLK